MDSIIIQLLYCTLLGLNTGFEFYAVHLLNWFPTTARESRLPCYVIHIWARVNRWPENIRAKLNVTNSGFEHLSLISLSELLTITQPSYPICYKCLIATIHDLYFYNIEELTKTDFSIVRLISNVDLDIGSDMSAELATVYSYLNKSDKVNLHLDSFLCKKVSMFNEWKVILEILFPPIC